MTLKRPPVRATAFMKLTRLTSMNPAWPVRMRTWEPKDGNADGESAASRRCASLVSGIHIQARAAATTPATA